MTLDEIKKLAQAATPGPWFASKLLYAGDGSPGYVTVGPFPVNTVDMPNKHCHDEDTICEVWHGNYDAEANANMIAALSPERVLAMLAVIEAAKAMRPYVVIEHESADRNHCSCAACRFSAAMSALEDA